MAKKELQLLVAEQKILNRIYVVRGEKVMLDRDLAEMFGVDTKVFNQSVKRNLERFPKDFMFALNEKEWKNLRSQFVTSSWGGVRYKPNVFTEQGEKEVKGNSKDIENIFMVLKELVEKQIKPAVPRQKIGFKQYE